MKKKWLITGVAGFIGSNILERLLKLNQVVIGLDNLTTGSLKNLNEVRSSVSKKQWKNFKFEKGDICNLKVCKKVVKNVDYVLHQAAVGSVPRSIKYPLKTSRTNISGFLNMLFASKEAGIKNFVFASSSSVYGDNLTLPKKEKILGQPLSPYAASKFINELFAEVFFKSYNLSYVGLRYFNVFGRRQNPNGNYAAVMPLWINNMINNKKIKIYGDGKTSRDFCYIENVVEANIKAALCNNKAKNKCYNIACGKTSSLNELFNIIKKNLFKCGIEYKYKPIYCDFRKGDIRSSLASINQAKLFLNYKPIYLLEEGISKSLIWYLRK